MSQDDVKKTPPYVSGATFFSALDILTAHELPQQIDKSVFRTFSGGVQRQVFQALQYMGLMDTSGKPTETLEEYAVADAEGRKTILEQALRERFPTQVAILPNGTLKQLLDSFDQFDLEPSVKGKCVVFLITLAKRVGMAIGQHISKGTRTRGPRVAGAGRKRKTEPEVKGTTPPEEKHDENMVVTSIPVGPGKMWKIITDKAVTKEEVARFLQMIDIVLGMVKK